MSEKLAVSAAFSVLLMAFYVLCGAEVERLALTLSQTPAGLTAPAGFAAPALPTSFGLSR